MQYYGTRLSENISRRDPEGYLLCLNVPVARTGIQEYMPEELGLPPGPEPVPVSRSETEVFSPETIASFEGMPVTNDHPPDGVTIENIRSLQKGHAHNIRRGAGEESDLLLADLIITDERLIEAILAGKREISCGYTYELHEENGQYFQRKIRGNHVAVVDAGRAGPRVSIKDRKPTQKSERSQPTMKKSLLKKLSRMARDGDTEAAEALAEAVEEIVETPAADPNAPAVTVIAAATEPEPAPADPVPAIENPAPAIDNDGIAAILERLDRLITLLTPAAPAADEDPAEALPEELAEVVEEALQAVEESAGESTMEEAAEEVAAIIEEVLSEEASTVLEPEDDECEEEPASRENADSLRVAVKAIAPALRRMADNDRRVVVSSIAARLPRKSAARDRVACALKNMRPQAAQPAADPYAGLAEKIMSERNPNYKK